jgi:hypothetical protein
VRHVLRLRQGHSGFDLEACLVREEVVVTGIGRWAEGKRRWSLGFWCEEKKESDKVSETINQAELDKVSGQVAALSPFSIGSITDLTTESGRELYGLLFRLAVRCFIRLLGRWTFFLRVMPCDSFGHVSLSELSLSDAASFMKQIWRFLPAAETRK